MRSAKVLVVDSNQATRAALSQALGEVGYRVATAATGSSAVGLLEAERPDLVVSYAQVEDMDGYELFTIVRNDATTMDTPFLLLAGRDRPVALAASEAGANMTVMTGEITLEAVVGRVGAILKPGASRDMMPSAVTVEPGAGPLWIAFDNRSPRPPEPGVAFEGSLDAIDLTEVTQAVALGRKTGRLVVSMGTGEGAILFESGRMTHAEFRGRTGEGAFGAIFTASQREPHARFRFSRMDPAEVVHGPRTVSRSVEQLLLSIAVRMDEGESSAPSSLAQREDG
jgi:CheY-like chemotaxis protein